MKTNCISGIVPTLEQLHEYRRTGSVPKADVMKMAGAFIPVHHPVTGEILGYGRAERVELSKSADLNSVFDDSPLMPVWQPDVVDIEKNADLADLLEDENAELAGIFPIWLQPN